MSSSSSAPRYPLGTHISSSGCTDESAPTPAPTIDRASQLIEIAEDPLQDRRATPNQS